MKLYLASLPTVDHEYLKHHLGCIFAVSTTTKYVSKGSQTSPWRSIWQSIKVHSATIKLWRVCGKIPQSQGSSWCLEIPGFYAAESATRANWSKCLPAIFRPKHSKVRRVTNYFSSLETIISGPQVFCACARFVQFSGWCFCSWNIHQDPECIWLHILPFSAGKDDPTMWKWSLTKKCQTHSSGKFSVSQPRWTWPTSYGRALVMRKKCPKIHASKIHVQWKIHAPKTLSQWNSLSHFGTLFVQRFSFTHRWCSLETRRGTSMTSGMATKFVDSKWIDVDVSSHIATRN